MLKSAIAAGARLPATSSARRLSTSMAAKQVKGELPGRLPGLGGCRCWLVHCRGGRAPGRRCNPPSAPPPPPLRRLAWMTSTPGHLPAVTVFSDLACPWCYVGQRRLDAALEAMPDVQVRRGLSHCWAPLGPGQGECHLPGLLPVLVAAARRGAVQPCRSRFSRPAAPAAALSCRPQADREWHAFLLDWNAPQGGAPAARLQPVLHRPGRCAATALPAAGGGCAAAGAVRSRACRLAAHRRPPSHYLLTPLQASPLRTRCGPSLGPRRLR